MDDDQDDRGPLIEHANFHAAHLAMHRLWTWAVGLPGYDKSMWKDLDAAISKLGHDGIGRRRAEYLPSTVIAFAVGARLGGATWEEIAAQTKVHPVAMDRLKEAVHRWMAEGRGPVAP